MRVVVLGGARICREALADALAQIPTVDVLGSFPAAEQTFKDLDALPAEVALVDGSFADAAYFVRRLVRAAPRLKAVVLGIEDTERDILACAETGAAALVLREDSFANLERTLHSVVHDECHCNSRVAAVLLRRVASLAPAGGAGTDEVYLTRREREIAEMVAADLSNKEIAQDLGISLSTVKAHVHSLLEKLGVSRRTEVRGQLRARTDY